MRDPKQTDFKVSVEGVGDFMFAKRTMRDELDIQVEYARIIKGVEATAWLAFVAGCIATFRVLTVFAPEGWDIDEMDPLDEETYAKISKVHAALVDKERSFRRSKREDLQAGGSGTLANSEVLVSQEVQPDTY